MRVDLYQAETARIATEQSALLALAKQCLVDGLALSPLEQSGVLHALQILIENAIGKAKQLVKAQNEPVPVSAYDAFAGRDNAAPDTIEPTFDVLAGLGVIFPSLPCA